MVAISDNVQIFVNAIWKEFVIMSKFLCTVVLIWSHNFQTCVLVDGLIEMFLLSIVFDAQKLWHPVQKNGRGIYKKALTGTTKHTNFGRTNKRGQSETDMCLHICKKILLIRLRVSQFLRSAYTPVKHWSRWTFQ